MTFLLRFTGISTLFGLGFGLATFPREEYDRACRDVGRLAAVGLMVVNAMAVSAMFFAVGVAIDTSMENTKHDDPAISCAVVSMIGFMVGTAFFAK